MCSVCVDRAVEGAGQVKPNQTLRKWSWTPQKLPKCVNSPRQKCCIFVVRRHDYAVSLKTPEIFGQSEDYLASQSRSEWSYFHNCASR